MTINTVYNIDCLQGLKALPDQSVNLILTDPPYNIKKAEWDTWKTIDGYINFMGEVFKECERVLKPNGSMYFFHNDFLQMVELQNFINKYTRFKFNSLITWDKGNVYGKGWKNPQETHTLRTWFPTCEYILYYTFQDMSGWKSVKRNINNFTSLRNYFKKIQEYIGLNKKEIVKRIGHSADHCFRWSSSQWEFPTEQTYQKIVDTFHIAKYKKYRLYEDIKKEYSQLTEQYKGLVEGYESQRYIHNLDKEHNNIWTSKYKNKGKLHPTQKPLDILERIIKTSTNEGDLVVDCFNGSGSTSVASINTNRNFLGFETNQGYFCKSIQRIETAINTKERGE